MFTLFPLLAAIGSASLPSVGDIDSSFGIGGVAKALLPSQKPGTSFDQPAIVIQRDGKLVTCSTVYTGGASGYDIVVTRFTVNGALDGSFDLAGQRRIDFDGGAGVDQCVDIAIDEDQNIVVAGTTKSGTASNDFAIARLAPDGSYDTSFAGSGKKTIDVQVNSNDQLGGIALARDGAILLAGTTSNQFSAVRLLRSGVLDTTFNGTGKLTVGFGLGGVAGPDQLSGVMYDQDENIVLTGNTVANGSVDFAISKVLSNGALDPTFGGSGKVVVALNAGGVDGSNTDYLIAAIPVIGGNILLAGVADISGTSSSSHVEPAVVRLFQNGTLDTTFGVGGKLILAASGLPESTGRNILGAAELPNGEVLLAGSESTSTGSALAMLLKIKRTGVIDTQFGSATGTPGERTYDLGSPESVQLLTGIAFQGGQVVVRGQIATAPYQYDVFAMRLYNDLIFSDLFE